MGRSFLDDRLGRRERRQIGGRCAPTAGVAMARLAGPCLEDRPRLAELAQHLLSLRPGVPRRGGPRRRLEPPDPAREELGICRGSHQLVRSAADAEFFARWIGRLEAAARAATAWNTGAEREEVLRQFGEARAIFEARAR